MLNNQSNIGNKTFNMLFNYNAEISKWTAGKPDYRNNFLLEADFKVRL